MWKKKQSVQEHGLKKKKKTGERWRNYFYQMSKQILKLQKLKKCDAGAWLEKQMTRTEQEDLYVHIQDTGLGSRW